MVRCISQISFMLQRNVTYNYAKHIRKISSGPKNIGFVGLGNMGRHMASNLLTKGHTLHVYDIAEQPCKMLQEKGAKVYSNATDIAKIADFVITMLPNSDIVSKTYFNMVQNNVNKNSIFIDSSTIDPTTVKMIQKHVEDNGARFIDAPVSGGVPGAEAATLTFMVGAKPEEFRAVEEILKCMGRRIVYCGEYGMGQAAKLCNNMMLGISMIGTAETMNLAIRQGLKPEVFLEILNSSTGRCWSSESYNPVPGLVASAPANNNYKGGFSTSLITKDLGLASAVAISSNTPIPLGSMAHQIYRTLLAKGFGDNDFSVIYKFLKNENEE